jgi:predicted nucleic acid-binding protein
VRVVADTGPLHYVVLIGVVDVLPRLFGRVTIPRAVRNELDRSATPAAVLAWIQAPPPWLSIASESWDEHALALPALDDGERAAIALATALHADLLLMDDRAGAAAARTRGFAVTGTLGLLDRAARRGLIDLKQAVTRLQATSFHVRPALIESLLASHRSEDSA